MKREYPNYPIPAVGVVVFKGDHILLIKRNKPPKAAEWSIPGGAQNIAETLKDAAAREVLEETNIKIKNLRLLDAVDFIDKDQHDKIRYHYSLIDYMADYASGDLIAGDDALIAKWVPITDLPSYNLWETTAQLIETATEIKNVYRKSK